MRGTAISPIAWVVSQHCPDYHYTIPDGFMQWVRIGTHCNHRSIVNADIYCFTQTSSADMFVMYLRRYVDYGTHTMSALYLLEA